ncbi:MAG: cytochrome c oxidase subunit II [Balneolaceae bacterium]
MGRLFDFMLPEAKSPTADSTDALFHFINEVSFILLLGITIAIIFFAIKYRRKSDDDVTPVIKHNNALEITWSVIPLILSLIVFAWGYSGYLNLKSVPDDAYEIKVNAFKWGWNFEYSNGAISPAELHVPAGRPIKLVMQSRDIIHSFFVPEYRIKQDVLPNRYTYVWFSANEPGESHIFCAEYCGTDHSGMLAKVIAHEPDDFDTWLTTSNTGASDDPVEHGKSLLTLNGCQSCHSVDGSKGIGPTLKGIWGHDVTLSNGSTVTVDENYIRESILDPQAKIVKGFELVPMTSFMGILDDKEIDSIIEYIKTLK